MQPYYAKKSKNKNNKLYIKLFLLVVLSFFWPQIKSFTSPQFENFVSKYFIKTDTGIWSDINLYIVDRKSLKDNIKNLNIDNVYLENKVSLLQHKITEYGLKQLESENGNIDSVLGYSLGSKDNLIYNSFIINVGYRDGIKDGAIVYTRGRQPVGNIIEIHNSNSTVDLLSREGNEVVGILKSTHDKINMIGNGGGEFIAKVKNSLIDNLPDYQSLLRTEVYYADDVSMIIGEIVVIEKQKDEDVSLIHIKGKYNPSTQTIFFVDK